MATGQSSQSPQDATVVIAQPASIQPVATFSPVAEPGSAPAQAAPQSPTPEPIPVPDTATTRILDALVSNSLPVVEDTVQLPTHLEFFGDSQGPRRLRIDPAQPALRGPHTAVRSSVARNSAAEESLQ